jgi:hypothetical protein
MGAKIGFSAGSRRFLPVPIGWLLKNEAGPDNVHGKIDKYKVITEPA